MSDPWFYKFESFADSLVRISLQASIAMLGQQFPSVGFPLVNMATGWDYAGKVYEELHPNRTKRKNDAIRDGVVTGSAPNGLSNKKRRRVPLPIKHATHWSDIFTK